jgi:hypothetical protein
MSWPIRTGEVCLVRLGKWHAQDGPPAAGARVRVPADYFGPLGMKQASAR